MRRILPVEERAREPIDDLAELAVRNGTLDVGRQRHDPAVVPVDLAELLLEALAQVLGLVARLLDDLRALVGTEIPDELLLGRPGQLLERREIVEERELAGGEVAREPARREARAVTLADVGRALLVIRHGEAGFVPRVVDEDPVLAARAHLEGGVRELADVLNVDRSATACLPPLDLVLLAELVFLQAERGQQHLVERPEADVLLPSHPAACALENVAEVHALQDDGDRGVLALAGELDRAGDDA